MSKQQLINNLTPNKEYDGYEEVVIFFESTDGGKTGTWVWTYTLYRKPGTYLLRRLGTTGLNNPGINPQHIHRRLCRDPRLGAWVPKPEFWFQPGAGRNAGYMFVQEQRVAQGQEMHQRAQA